MPGRGGAATATWMQHNDQSNYLKGPASDLSCAVEQPMVRHPSDPSRTPSKSSTAGKSDGGSNYSREHSRDSRGAVSSGVAVRDEEAPAAPDVAAGSPRKETKAWINSDDSAVMTGSSELLPIRSSRSSNSSLDNWGSRHSYFERDTASQQAVARMLGSAKFDFAMGVVILFNSATIGVEQTMRLNDMDTSILDMMEHAFLSIYILELGLRFFGDGWRCLKSEWVRFDALLVIMGIVTNWILTPALGEVEELGPLMVLRTGRLLRLARTVRLLIKFRELWMLVRGLLSSASTMFYTLLLLFIILYIFGCISLEMITLHYRGDVNSSKSDVFAEVIETNFRSLPVAMLTLIQFVCFDNIVYIYKPLMEESPILSIFFIGVILVVGIVLMNLVTAVIVNSALEQAIQDKDLMKTIEESKKKKLVKDLRRIFIRLDEDGSGEVSREEIMNMSDADKQVIGKLMTIADPVEMFDALDVDGSGDIGIDEFCDGIWQVAISNTPMEIKRMEKQMDAVRRDIQETKSAQDDLQNNILQLIAELRGEEFKKPPEDLKSPKTPRSGRQTRVGRHSCHTSPKSSVTSSNGAPKSSSGNKLSVSSVDYTLLLSETPQSLQSGSVPVLNSAQVPRPMPPWARELVVQLRDICTTDVRRAMDEACLSLVAQAAASAAALKAASATDYPTFSGEHLDRFSEQVLHQPLASSCSYAESLNAAKFSPLGKRGHQPIGNAASLPYPFREGASDEELPSVPQTTASLHRFCAAEVSRRPEPPSDTDKNLVGLQISRILAPESQERQLSQYSEPRESYQQLTAQNTSRARGRLADREIVGI